jgi:hypothetical protein
MYPAIDSPLTLTWSLISDFADASPPELKKELGPFSHDNPNKWLWLKAVNKHYWPEYCNQLGEVDIGAWSLDHIGGGIPKKKVRMLNRVAS